MASRRPEAEDEAVGEEAERRPADALRANRPPQASGFRGCRSLRVLYFRPRLLRLVSNGLVP